MGCHFAKYYQSALKSFDISKGIKESQMARGVFVIFCCLSECPTMSSFYKVRTQNLLLPDAGVLRFVAKRLLLRSWDSSERFDL